MSSDSGRIDCGLDQFVQPDDPQQTSILEEFARSAAYSGLQAPANAVCQLVGLQVPQVIDRPKEAGFATSNWYAQQFGAGIGALPLFMAVHKGLDKVCPINNPIGRAAISGFIYEGLFHPVDGTTDRTHLALERGKNAFAGAATFATMGFVSDAFGPSSVSKAARGAVTWRATIGDGFMNAGRGAASGVAGGLASASLQALDQGRLFATPEEYLRSAYSFGLLGAGLDVLGAHRRRSGDPAIVENGTTTREGSYFARSGTVVWRTNGSIDGFARGATTQLCEGDSILKPADLLVKRKGISFKHNNLNWETDKFGRVTLIDDPINKTKTAIKYTGRDFSGESKIRTVDTVKRNGQPDQTLKLRYDHVNEVYRQGSALGTDATLLLDGTIKITGTNEIIGTKVGSTLWDASAQKVEAIRLNRNGSQVWEYNNGAEITKTRDGNVLQVKHGGNCTDYSYDSSGNLAKLSFAGGRELTLKDGWWLESKGYAVASQIDVSPNGTLTFTPHPKLRMSRFPDMQMTKATYYPSIGQMEISINVEAKAPLDSKAVPKPPTNREILDMRLARGEVAEKGSTYISRTAPSESLSYDQQGNLFSIQNRSGQVINIQRDPAGTPVRLDFSRGGVIERSLVRHKQGWQVLDSQGQIQGKRHAVSIELDGSITEFNHSRNSNLDWTGIRERPDGLRVHVDKNVRERVPATELSRERQRVTELVSKMAADPTRAARFKGWMETFETRLSKRQPPVAEDELANTYYQLDKLLSIDRALYGRQDRLALAEQFMFKAAYPHTITQGGFGTCNVTAEIENRFVTKFPSSAIRMVTDVALTGRFITSDGIIVDLRQLKNVLGPFKTKVPDFNTTEFDSQRDLFDQLCQTIAVNTHWQGVRTKTGKAASTVSDLRRGSKFQSGDLRYEFTEQEKKPEILCDYGNDPPSRRLAWEFHREKDIFTDTTIRIGAKIPAQSPELEVQFFKNIEYQILGFNDKPHIISSKAAGEAGAQLVDSAAELTTTLLKMKEGGAFPATVVVDPFSRLMGGRTHQPTLTASHVINVQDVYMVNNEWVVDITNQWGSKWNYIGKQRAITVQSLWETMREVEPKKPVEEIDPARSSNYWMWAAAAEAIILLSLHGLKDQQDQTKAAGSPPPPKR